MNKHPVHNQSPSAWLRHDMHTLKTRFMGPIWGPSGADRTQVGAMLAPWTLLSGTLPALLTLSSGIHVCVPLTKGSLCRDLVCFLLLAWTCCRTNMSSCRWFETPWHSCDVTVMMAYHIHHSSSIINRSYIEGYCSLCALSTNINTLRRRQNGRPFLHFPMHCLQWKYLTVD